MKKIFFILVFSSFLKNSFCQEIIISNSNKIRLLTWADFTGQPGKSGYDANTYWKINYSVSGITFKGDTAIIEGLSVKLELDKDQSWIKPGKESLDLLKHEQGHFDLGIICQNELIETFKKTVLLKTNYQQKLKDIFSDIMTKYIMIGMKYDKETDHYKNRDNQKKWDDFFAAQLNKMGIIFKEPDQL
jgi:hypothetical protein